MSKRSRLSRDQKRKQKLAKRGVRERPWAPSSGTDRYRGPRFVEITFQTEVGIYEGYVGSGRKLTDNDVEHDLNQLILDLGGAPVAELIHAAPDNEGPERGPAGAMVLFRWQELRDQGMLPPREDLVGVLRSILRSLATWRARSGSSRGYMNYLEGFMRELGVSVQAVSKDGEPIEDEPLDELYEIGRMWLEGSDEARLRFTELANEMLSSGESEAVANSTQRLLASVTTASPEFATLSELTIRAQKTPGKRQTSGFAPGLKSFVARLGGW